MLKYQNIIRYECKKVKYKGRIELYSNFSYSRYALSTINDAINFAKRNSAEMHIITFKSYEMEFQTRFHFRNVEGLNCLEGEDIAVIRSPNYPEYYYLLIGMLCGTSGVVRVLHKSPNFQY